MIGTPGLGKSCTLLSMKYFHDLRVKYFIKNGSPPPNSVFSFHFKILYFHSATSLYKIINKINEEIKKDFGEQIFNENKLDNKMD